MQNIMNDALSEVIGAWWRIADHTTGNETGRMMIVNGFNPGAVFFHAVIPVQPNTNYLFTSWILNLFRVTGYPNPELGVRVLGQNGGVLYSATLGILIPVNVNAPEWRQIGSVINSQDNTSLTVEFLSEGPEVIGNDYAIDDVSFQEIQEPLFIPVKTVDRPAANVGETVRYTVTLTNTCESPLTGRVLPGFRAERARLRSRKRHGKRRAGHGGRPGHRFRTAGRPGRRDRHRRVLGRGNGGPHPQSHAEQRVRPL